MDIRTGSSALLLIRQMFDPGTATRPRIAPDPQKPRFAPAPVAQPFPRATPEEEGVPSAHVAGFLNTLAQDRTLDPHGVLLLRHGRVIAQAGYGAYRQDIWHITHSECKSITGLAIGMLIDEGKLSLEDKLVDLMGAHTNPINRLTHAGITVRHLLTMTSGIAFNEAGSVTETNWVRCFLESTMLPDPGKHFAYNSMNTYMLSAIVKEITGQGLVDYLTPRLFEPLGITNFFWETCPMGIEKGGWGLYILPEDIAKIGQLVLQYGEWNGQRLVSRAWIEEATTAQVTTPEALGAYNYGYQIWVGRKEHTFLFNGMFGQNVLGYFDNGILLVSNAGNNELFQQSNFYRYASRYFHQTRFARGPIERERGAQALLAAAVEAAQAGARALPAPHALTQTVSNKQYLRGAQALCEQLNGTSFYARDPKAASVGLYPLYAQALQNNYTKGLVSLAFAYLEGTLWLTVAEKDETHRLPVGFEAPMLTELTIHGEPHRVAVSGRFTANEDDILVLKLRVSFLEVANSRFIKIFFHEDCIVTQWYESPGVQYVMDGLDAMRAQSALLDTIVNKATDEELLRFRIRRAFEPVITLER